MVNSLADGFQSHQSSNRRNNISFAIDLRYMLSVKEEITRKSFGQYLVYGILTLESRNFLHFSTFFFVFYLQRSSGTRRFISFILSHDLCSANYIELVLMLKLYFYRNLNRGKHAHSLQCLRVNKLSRFEGCCSIQTPVKSLNKRSFTTGIVAQNNSNILFFIARKLNDLEIFILSEIFQRNLFN